MQVSDYVSSVCTEFLKPERFYFILYNLDAVVDMRLIRDAMCANCQSFFRSSGGSFYRSTCFLFFLVYFCILKVIQLIAFNVYIINYLSFFMYRMSPARCSLTS